jgi:hypothetical protein
MSVERTHPTLRSRSRILSVRSTRQLPQRGRSALVKGLQLPGLTSGWEEFEVEDDRSGGAVLHVDSKVPL